MAPDLSSALVYAIVNCEVTVSGRDNDTACNDSRLIKAVEAELGEQDELVIVKAQHFAVALGATTELAAMQFARLVRNAFQQFYIPRRHESLSIGVVLHGQKAPERNVLRLTAQCLASSASKKKGNNIEVLTLPAS